MTQSKGKEVTCESNRSTEGFQSPSCNLQQFNFVVVADHAVIRCSVCCRLPWTVVNRTGETCPQTHAHTPHANRIHSVCGVYTSRREANVTKALSVDNLRQILTSNKNKVKKKDTVLAYRKRAFSNQNAIRFGTHTHARAKAARVAHAEAALPRSLCACSVAHSQRFGVLHLRAKRHNISINCSLLLSSYLGATANPITAKKESKDGKERHEKEKKI